MSTLIVAICELKLKLKVQKRFFSCLKAKKYAILELWKINDPSGVLTLVLL